MAKKKHNNASNIAAAQIAGDFTQRHTERTMRLFDDADRLKDLSRNLVNVGKEQAQGNMFEQLEVMKFNFDALQKDSELHAKATAAMGLPTDPVDINIFKGRDVIAEIQAKSSKTAAGSTYQLSNSKYGEMGRLAPSEQTEKVKQLLDQRIESQTLKAGDYEQTRRNLLDTLEHDDIKSSGTTYKESLSATKTGVADKIANQTKLDAALSDMHQSGKTGGNVGAAVQGGMSAAKGVYALYKGEAEVGEVVVDVAVSTAKGYVTGYATTAISKGVVHTTTNLLGKSAAQSLSKSNAPAAIAAAIVSTGQSMSSYLAGDLTGEELMTEVTNVALTSGCSFYAGMVGQFLIPVPIVGGLVGSAVGYFVGNLIHQSSLIALGNDAPNVVAAKERRAAIEAMCLTAIPMIEQHRKQMQIEMDKHFGERKSEFDACFEILDTSLVNWDVDAYVGGLARINKQFGASLQFKTFDEFDDFMESEDAFVL